MQLHFTPWKKCLIIQILTECPFYITFQEKQRENIQKMPKNLQIFPILFLYLLQTHFKMY